MLSAEEAAQILGLQVRTVRNYVREGRLPGIRIGKQYRIARSDLEVFTSGFLQRAATGGPAPTSTAQASHVRGVIAEVSSVVQLDRVGPADCDRLERTLQAACLPGPQNADSWLRVEPLYDESRQRLKVIVVGDPAETADLLRIIDAFTREPG